MPLLESGEMYLETILILSEQTNNRVRAIDIGEYMGFSKPSVSRAMGLLKKGGYTITDDDGFITLTEEGKDIARKIYERHRILTEALMLIGVSRKTASEDACKIEHDISDESFAAIKEHINKSE